MGNSLYNIDKMKQDNFKWWIMRLKAISEKLDTIRIVHLRGLEVFWTLVYGDENVLKGKWIKGPEKDFIIYL
jgi:4-alpha-glucanotransferase